MVLVERERGCLAAILVGVSLLILSAASPAGAQEAAPPPNYKILPNDLLEIRVFQEDDLTTTARVPRDGNIIFPLIGSVRVGGLSVAQATDRIRALLAKDYLVSPQVNMSIMEYSKRRFTIIGQVQNPGTYEFPSEENLDLLEAVGIAGGFTRIANPGKIALKRQDTVLRLDAKSMARDGKVQRFIVLPGDTISVPESLF